MKEQLELHKEFRDKQEKFAYYKVALCVTSIGFAVTQTMGKSLVFTQIPLAFAVLCWGVSIYCGLQFISKIVSSVRRNFLYLDLMQGNDPIAGTNLHNIRIGKEVFDESNKKMSKLSVRLYSWQGRLFYLGIVCFLAWRILEMYFTR